MRFKPGERWRLLDFGDVSVTYQARLRSLGLHVGTEVEVARVAPLGCPVQLVWDEQVWSLRQSELASLTWHRVA